MICPKCGQKLKVKNTEKLLPCNLGTPRPIVRKASAVVGWYTQDFVARVRVCVSECNYSTLTIEIEATDILNMFAEVAASGIGVVTREGEK